ncbi:MutS-like protein [Thoreauomyces humboldtii]|nr:MutS-like protein [Thoreauomyces humboldtii]
MVDKQEDRPDFSLDRPAEQGFVTFFKGLPEKPESTIRLFERNDYYSVHGEDALYVAQNVYKTSTVIKYLGDERNGIPSCTLSKLNTTSFLRDLLLVRLYRVEIWSSEGRKGSQWQVTKRASPGNLVDVEDILFLANDVSSSPVVAVVKVESKGDQKLLGVAYTDATTQRVIGVAEFVDNDTFSNFESLLIQLSVKECLVADDSQNYELLKISGMLERCGVVITHRKKSEFNTKDIDQDLDRLLSTEQGVSTAALPERELHLAMSCVACLIRYLGLLTVETNFHGYTLHTHDLAQYMRLDAAAVRALNLMPGPQDGSNKSMSLYGLLNKCKTPQGSRLLAQWLKQPLMSLPDITTRQDLVDVFCEDGGLRGCIQDDHLKNFPDLHRLAKRFQKQTASLQDVVRVYQVVLRLPGLRDTFEDHSATSSLLKEQFTNKLVSYLSQLSNLTELVETTIDLAAVDHHDFRIKADFDADLQAVRVQMTAVHDQLEPEAVKAADDLDVEYEKKLKFERNAQYGYIMRLSRKESGIIRGRKGYLELATRKDGVYFTTSTLKRLNDQYQQLTSEYESVQGKLVKEVIEITASYFPVLEMLNQLIARLDVLISIAHVAVNAPIPYVRPVLTESGPLELEASRHPCLEMQSDVSFIDNDVRMDRGDSALHVITGPNMGGKSTYIRQIGCVALLAQIGSRVPCRSARLPVLDAVLARVGAGDSTLRGVSTFMSEMLETAAILRSATERSLLIIDELGRGTSTYDGFGLAWAIAHHVVTEIKCLTLFATHFHELTRLEEQVAAGTVRNRHVAAVMEEGRVTLLYRVREGPCDQSFGIHVAELAGFPEGVVRMAKRKAAELEDFDHQPDGGGGRREVRWKCGEEERKDGEALVERFMEECRSLGDGMEGVRELEALRDRYADEFASSPFVREVLATF